jgi:hypothetical protein
VNAAAAPFAVNQRLLTGGTASTSQATIAATGAGGTDSGSAASVATGRRPPGARAWSITVQKSTEASYFDGTTWHSAFQENLTLFLVEAYYGFVMGDKNAFVAYTKGTAAF